jgi:hypothetical protein
MLYAKRLIQYTASAHPERVRFLYRKYGIDAPVTPATLALAVVGYGAPFISDLTSVIVEGNTASVEGTNMLPEVTVTPPTGAESTGWGGWDKISNGLTNFSELLGQSGGLISLVGGLFGGGSDDELKQENQELKLREETARKQQQTILYAAAAVVGILLIVLIIKR